MSPVQVPNPLHPGESGKQHAAVVEKTIRLAETLGVRTVVTMSGCPGAGPHDENPNWITHVTLPWQEQALDYQWNEVLIPYWQGVGKLASGCGVKVAIENLGATMIHNPANMLRLRQHVDASIGMSFDPSHHIWMAGDPAAALRLLGKAADLGYEYIELSPRDDFIPWWVRPRAHKERIAEFKKALSDHDVKLASVLPMYRWASPHEDERKAAVGYWKEAIRATVEMGCDTMNSEFGRGPSPDRSHRSNCCGGHFTHEHSECQIACNDGPLFAPNAGPSR